VLYYTVVGATGINHVAEIRDSNLVGEWYNECTMSDNVTRDELKGALKEQTDEIISVLQTFVQHMDERFNKIETQLDSLDQKYDHLINTIDGFISRIDKYEAELAARDNQFEKLLEWARKVSIKTGIPLENLQKEKTSEEAFCSNQSVQINAA